jgi:hypothetical protein
MEEAVSDDGEDVAIDMGLRSVRLRDNSCEAPVSEEAGGIAPDELESTPEAPESARLPTPVQPQSLPNEQTQSWTATNRTSPTPSAEEAHAKEPEKNVVPNPLLDLLQSRINSRGKGALYPGSSFKGTQTSGRSAYEVEVKIAVSISLRSRYHADIRM